MSQAEREFEGLSVVVTGAGRGIGMAIARSFAEAGAKVILSDISDADSMAEEWRREGLAATFVRADVTSLDDMTSLMSKAVELNGGLDILVANAAFSLRDWFWSQPMEDARRTVEVTLWGTFNAVRSATVVMLPRRTGSIVVVGSPHANVPSPKCAAYNMAKAAVDQFALTAAAELLDQGIRVNIVHPGWTNTPGERRFFTEEEISDKGGKLAIGRLADPREIARAVLFLASPKSCYINGSTLTVDGGLKLPRENILD